MNAQAITSPGQDRWLAGSPAVILLLVLLLFLGTGCSGMSRPSDPEEGRKALMATLDAWKSGAAPGTLSPLIHASDGDWKSGLTLQNYKAHDEPQRIGTDLNFAVDLELKTRQGRLVKKSATYAVTTYPQYLVLRMDD